MGGIFAEVDSYMHYYLGQPDPRVEKFFLFKSSMICFSIITVYWTVLYMLKRIMAYRKAFDLREILIAYNAFQVTFAIHICKEVFVCAYLSGYKLTGESLHISNVGLPMRMVNAFWLFYLSKIIDLMDTVFFVLRKKNAQLTFLHIYHHTSMIFNWYLGTLYLPGGQTFFSVLFNSFVHVIMYTYYMLSAMGPHMQKYLWWKKYLTQIQLIQFVMVISHISYGMYHGVEAPLWLSWFTITYLCTMMVLFSRFYYKSYKSQSSTQRHQHLTHGDSVKKA